LAGAHDGNTRIRLTIEDDLPDLARHVAATLKAPVSHVVNEALGAGLPSVEVLAESRPYRTTLRNMGLRTGRNLDKVQDLLAQAENEDCR